MSAERILIVEDSMIVVIHLKNVLQSAGYQVIASVATAEDAIVLTEREHPDLILMDIMLAGEMDGIRASQIIQERWRIPVIYLTALTDRATIERAKATGPFNYVTKPFNEDDIITRIELSLYKHKLEKEHERQRLAHLIEGQEQERERVSRELHDGLGQLLNAIQLHLEALSAENWKQVKSTVTTLIAEALQESHRISSNLLPVKLMHFDLVTCIKAMCEELDSQKVSVTFQTKGDVKVTPNQKLGIYRITQEALQNALKHAGCSKIFVQMYSDERWIYLSVEDDGKGFAREKATEGFGLKNIAHRAQAMNGKFEIETSPDFGTLISVTIPMEQETI